jgi:hypothetical protein
LFPLPLSPLSSTGAGVGASVENVGAVVGFLVENDGANVGVLVANVAKNVGLLVGDFVITDGKVGLAVGANVLNIVGTSVGSSVVGASVGTTPPSPAAAAVACATGDVATPTMTPKINNKIVNMAKYFLLLRETVCSSYSWTNESGCSVNPGIIPWRTDGEIAPRTGMFR